MPTHLTMLPFRLPACPNRRLALFTLRRMAGEGLNDAHAAHALFTAFRGSFRRPLVLMRALVAEVSRASTHSIVVAPCCALRMTRAEATLLEALTTATASPRETHDRLAALLGTPNCLGVLGSAQALAQAFDDLGRPLG